MFYGHLLHRHLPDRKKNYRGVRRNLLTLHNLDSILSRNIGLAVLQDLTMHLLSNLLSQFVFIVFELCMASSFKSSVSLVIGCTFPWIQISFVY